MADLTDYADVDLPAQQVWDVIGDFAAISKWASIIKEQTTEDTPEGRVRTLTMGPDRTVRELEVVSSQFSYTYAMLDRPADVRVPQHHRGDPARRGPLADRARPSRSRSRTGRSALTGATRSSCGATSRPCGPRWASSQPQAFGQARRHSGDGQQVDELPRRSGPAAGGGRAPSAGAGTRGSGPARRPPLPATATRSGWCDRGGTGRPARPAGRSGLPGRSRHGPRNRG